MRHTFADPAHLARAVAARRDAILAGRRPSGTVPYGYRADGPRLVVHEQEAAVVRWIFASAPTMSLARIARVLNLRDVPGPRGGRWSRASLSWLVHNDVYAGRLHMGPIGVDGPHEPLVTARDFARTRDAVKARRKHPGPRRATGGPRS